MRECNYSEQDEAFTVKSVRIDFVVQNPISEADCEYPIDWIFVLEL